MVETQSAITLKGFVVRDLTLDAPQPFRGEWLEDLKVDIAIITGFSKEYNSVFTISFEISIAIEDVFNLKFVGTGIFETSSEINSEFKNSSFIKSSAPAIVFPYVRNYVSNISSSSGYPNIVLPCYNFTRINEEGSTNNDALI